MASSQTECYAEPLKNLGLLTLFAPNIQGVYKLVVRIAKQNMLEMI